MRPGRWERRLPEIFRQRTRAERCEVFVGSDACFSPVLSVAETSHHPHHVARGSLPVIDGIAQSAPAPRPPRRSGTDTVLPRWGIDAAMIDKLRSLKALQ